MPSRGSAPRGAVPERFWEERTEQLDVYMLSFGSVGNGDRRLAEESLSFNHSATCICATSSP